MVSLDGYVIAVSLTGATELELLAVLLSNTTTSC